MTGVQLINLPTSLDSWLSGRIDVIGECWEWRGAKSHGYGVLRYRQKNYRAHRFTFEAHHGREPVGMLLHSCDNRPCVNPDHLREGTAAENSRDAVDRGGIARGEDRHNVILNEQAVKALRYLHDRGYSYGRLGRAYGLSRWTVRSATTGRAWKYLPKDGEE